MKTTRLPLLLAGFLSLSSLLHAQSITSAVPDRISYQGRVLNSTGAPVGDTTTGTPVNRTVTFRIWNHASNTGSTNLLYSEQQVVTIADGNFSVLVGQGVATTGSQFPSLTETNFGPGASPPVSIANAFGGSERYLGVTVDDANGATVDSEIAPRQQIVSSAFAIRSRFAESVGTGASTGTVLTTMTGGSLGVSGPNTSITTINPQFLVTADDITERLRVGVDSTGNGTSFLQSWKEGTGATNLLLQPNGGNVFIGTTAPLSPAKLFVHNANAPLDSAVFYSPNTGPNASHIHNGLNGDVYWRSASSAGKVILQDTGGKVGIGTANPFAQFQVGGHWAWASPTFQVYGGYLNNDPLTLGSFVFNPPASNQAALSFKAVRSSAAFGWQGTSVGITFDVDGVGPVGGGIWMNNGNVGIGTTTPSVAKLVVNGVGGAETLGSHYTYANTGVIAAPGSFPGIGGISIKATDAVHAAFYRALSDARIKVIEGVSNGVADLATLSRIEVTDYTHKDVIGKGKDRSKKVIAQQVEKVFPQAVTKTVDVVPDIYKSAKIVDGWIELTTDLKKGERVRLIGNKHDEIHEVLEVEKDRFRTAYRPAPKSDAKATGSPIASAPSADAPKGDSKTKAAGKAAAGKDQSAVEADRIFVFGREVKDFRVVDYEAIAMLNVSATQELARKLAASEAAVKALQQENATLRGQEETNAKRLAEMTATDKAFEAKLIALEKRLTADKTAARTVSTQ